MSTSLSVPHKSGSFIVPKQLLEDDSAVLLDLYDWNGEQNPQHPLFRYQDGFETRTISWRAAVDATHRAAYYFEARTRGKSENEPTIAAVLANTDTITYFCSIIGLLRAGLVVFPISTRNSPDAVHHLLNVTRAQHLLVSSEPMVLSLAQAALKHGTQTSVVPMPVFEDLFASGPTEAFPRGTRDPNALTMILHSSGSTAFPKPIYRDARRVMEWTLAPWYGDINLTGVTIACHALPMFHGMGILQIGTAPSSGLILSTFKPSSPATIPTPTTFLEGIKATNSDIVFSVPFILEIWSTDADAVAYLKNLKGLVFGGGPLSLEVGNMLASQGVRLYAAFGSTEVGIVSKYFPLHDINDWEYMSFSEQMGPQFLPLGDGTYELMITAHDRWTPLIVNAKLEDRDAFATSDLFIPHETKSGLWKVYGRTDDQIMLSTGEKTNPGPLEAIMVQDPHVQSAIMFGRGRLQSGILIEPKKEFSVDVDDPHALEGFKNRIWPSIERLNAFAPQHSRIIKEMILVSSPTKPFTYTAKGTPRRHAVINEYAEEIDSLYNSLGTAPSDVPAPTTWDEGSTRDFIHALVRTVLKRDIHDDADIFRYGCDSLQATWIHNQILSALRDTVGDRSARFSPNSIYQAPSVAQLSGVVLEVAGHVQTSDTSTAMPRAQILRQLVSQYTASFPARPVALRQPTNDLDIVLVTGTTGGLGAHILVHLLQDPAVGVVYALNRVSASIKQQRTTFDRYGLDDGLLDSSKLRFLMCDLSQPSFGLDLSVYEEIRASTTHVIHNAWKVDFNQGLNAFEPLLAGVRNIVKLALSSPHVAAPRLLFTSSMGIFRKLPDQVPALEVPIDNPEICIGGGYSESKWVAEQILQVAHEKAGLKTTVVRLGQISRGYNGYWNEREWFPAVVKSALYVGCLPTLEGDMPIAWIPAYETGQVLARLRNSNEPILHLAHPSPVPWATVIEPIASELGAELVPYSSWLAALEEQLSAGDAEVVDKMRDNPALRLLDHFRSVDIGPSREPMGGVKMQVAKMLREAPDFAMPDISASSALRWIEEWQKHGFIAKSN